MDPITSITSITDIGSIIPRMLIGILLIVLWIPVIYYTEKNNKGNDEEYALLLNKIDTNIKVTDMTSKTEFKDIEQPTSNASDAPNTTLGASGFIITPELLKKYNNNIYLIETMYVTTKDDKGKETTNATVNTTIVLQNITIDGVLMEGYDYEYLAKYNKVFTTNIQDKNNTNTKYTIDIFSIPAGKQIMKIEGLKEFESELDMVIYNYEFGPREAAINTIKTRKNTMDKLQRWGGRLATFLMLFFGLLLLVSPLEFIVRLGSALPFPLSLMVVPGQIILTIYNSLSFIGALILTILMTFLIWSIINHPMVAILIGSLLIGFILYFNKHKIIKK